MAETRRIVILGSTGSIGRQAIDVVGDNPDRFRIVGLAAGSDSDALQSQAAALGVGQTALGPHEAVELARAEDADIVLNAIVGSAGLRATVAALEAGKTVALANKESLVAGGDVCLAARARGGGAIVPVDSEHSAIAQCLEGRPPSHVKRIVLTASGGPFRTRSDLSGVTPDEALAHPTWSMGPKITIDSATLMNKGLEVIEAHFLFGLGYESLDVLVHPQSAVHGIVEMVDGTLLMQAATTDMRIPIQAALSAPSRFGSGVPTLDLSTTGSLDFEPVDRERFPALDLAYDAGRSGGSCPAVLNAANEVAVGAFLEGRIGFTDIVAVVAVTLGEHDRYEVDALDAVLEADSWSRDRVNSLMDARVTGGAIG